MVFATGLLQQRLQTKGNKRGRDFLKHGQTGNNSCKSQVDYMEGTLLRGKTDECEDSKERE